MRGIRKKAEALGNLAIIGNGNLQQAQDFGKKQGKGLRSLVDGDRRSYAVLGYRRGMTMIFSPAAAVAAARATSQGFTQGKTQGDATQVGGTLVLRAGGKPVYFHRSGFAGDHPPVEDVLSALKEAAQAG